MRVDGHNLYSNQSGANDLLIMRNGWMCFNPFNPEFTIVIFIHYKPRIAVAILDL